MSDLNGAMRDLTASLKAREDAQRRIDAGIRELAAFAKTLGYTLVPHGKKTRVPTATPTTPAEPAIVPGPKRCSWCKREVGQPHTEACVRGKRSGGNKSNKSSGKTSRKAARVDALGRSLRHVPSWARMQDLLKKSGPLPITTISKRLGINAPTLYYSIKAHPDKFAQTTPEEGSVHVSLK